MVNKMNRLVELIVQGDLEQITEQLEQGYKLTHDDQWPVGENAVNPAIIDLLYQYDALPPAVLKQHLDYLKKNRNVVITDDWINIDDVQGQDSSIESAVDALIDYADEPKITSDSIIKDEVISESKNVSFSNETIEPTPTTRRKKQTSKNTATKMAKIAEKFELPGQVVPVLDEDNGPSESNKKNGLVHRFGPFVFPAKAGTHFYNGSQLAAEMDPRFHEGETFQQFGRNNIASDHERFSFFSTHVPTCKHQATQTEPMKKLRTVNERLRQAMLLKLVMTAALMLSEYHDHLNDSNVGKVSFIIGSGIMGALLWMMREDIAANTEVPTEQDKCLALFM